MAKTKKRRHWDRCSVFEEAHKYTCRNDFKHGCNSAYNVARKFGWIDEMDWLIPQQRSWDKESVFEEARKYKTRTDFATNAVQACKLARENGWLKDMPWLDVKYKSWNETSVIEESKKYKTRTEFLRNSSSAYNYAREHYLLDMMTWLTTPDMYDSTNYCVYAYEDAENKVAYVGVTKNLQRRHNEHSIAFTNPKRTSPVRKYFDNCGKSVPYPKCLKKCMSAEEGRAKEHEWREKYRKDYGYTMLNTGKTGKNTGSLGGTITKWTEDRIIEESKKYTSRNEFQKKCSPAYEAARKLGLIEKLFSPQHITWNDESVWEIALECESKIEFKTKFQSAYQYARVHDMLDRMVWFKRPTRYKWDKEAVFEESKKYVSRFDFKKNQQRVYVIACKNKWIEEIAKQNGWKRNGQIKKLKAKQNIPLLPFDSETNKGEANACSPTH